MKWKKFTPRAWRGCIALGSENGTLQTISVAMGIIPTDKREGSAGEINAVGLCGWLAQRSVIRTPGHQVRDLNHSFRKECGPSEKRREEEEETSLSVLIEGRIIAEYCEAPYTSTTIIGSFSFKDQT